MMNGKEISRQSKGGVIIDGKHIEIELPKEDKQLLWEINNVFNKHGWKGRVKQLVFDCGTPPPRPEEKPRCHKIKIGSGPHDEPIWMLVCFDNLFDKIEKK